MLSCNSSCKISASDLYTCTGNISKTMFPLHGQDAAWSARGVGGLESVSDASVPCLDKEPVRWVARNVSQCWAAQFPGKSLAAKSHNQDTGHKAAGGAWLLGWGRSSHQPLQCRAQRQLLGPASFSLYEQAFSSACRYRRRVLHRSITLSRRIHEVYRRSFRYTSECHLASASIRLMIVYCS